MNKTQKLKKLNLIKKSRTLCWSEWSTKPTKMPEGQAVGFEIVSFGEFMDGGKEGRGMGRLKRRKMEFEKE